MTTWNETDDKLLVQLYVDNKLDFLPICTKLKRKCKDVSQRLIDLKIVTHKKNIRGFNTNTDKTISNTNNSTNDLKLPTEELRKKTNTIFNQIDNIYEIFNNISSIYTNISNITNTSNTTNTSKEQIQ